MKRIIPILLCIVMVLGILPFAASAYGLISGGTIVVTGVTTPIAGDTAAVDGITATSTNLELYDAPYWCDESGNKFTGQFQPDTKYYLVLHVSGKADVGYISDATSIELEVNGAYDEIKDKGYAGNYHIYHVGYYAVKHYGGFDANYGPKLTIAPEDLSAALTPNDIQITPADNDYTVDALVTFNKKGGGEIAFDEHFAAGERYTVTFSLTVKNADITVFDDGVIAFINGDSCEGTVYAAGKTAEFTYEFANPATADAITYVALTQISTPVVGEAPQQTQFASSTAHVNVALLGWREGTAQTGADVAAFEADKTYTLWLKLYADETYVLTLADKSAVTANAGTVATLTTGWQGDNGSYYTVGIEFQTAGDPAELDLGTCEIDLSGDPILADTIPETAQNELGFLALGGYVNVTNIEGSGWNYDIDKDGTTDFVIYDEDGKTYWKVDPDTNLEGDYVIDIRALVPEMLDNYAAADTQYYSKFAFKFPSKTPVPVVVENPFVDVKEGDFFYEAVLWAVGHDPQVTNGLDATHFGPSETCTRAQVVTFLWRAKGCPEPTTTDNPFTDVQSTDYFYKAVLWAKENDVTAGTTETTFSPNAGCTRAQVVTFQWRANGKPAPTSTNNPFTDVTGGYYYDAVLWAVEKNITKGTSDTTFSPDDTCTRGQIVTFLYRDLG